MRWSVYLCQVYFASKSLTTNMNWIGSMSHFERPRILRLSCYSNGNSIVAKKYVLSLLSIDTHSLFGDYKLIQLLYASHAVLYILISTVDTYSQSDTNVWLLRLLVAFKLIYKILILSVITGLFWSLLANKSASHLDIFTLILPFLSTWQPLSTYCEQRKILVFAWTMHGQKWVSMVPRK